MNKTPPTVAEFIASLSDHKRETVTAVHSAIKKAVPKQKPYVTGGMGTLGGET